jgi:hypothetical protein
MEEKVYSDAEETCSRIPWKSVSLSDQKEGSFQKMGSFIYVV